MAIKLFGLDIGRSFIKICQVEGRGHKKVLKAAALVPTPEGGIITESPLAVTKIVESVKNCLEQARVDTDHCAISLIESQVVSRLIQLPPLTDKELSAAIDWEAEQYIPLPIKDVILQYHVVNRGAGGEGEDAKMDVLLVAAPKRVIDKYITIAHGAGLVVDFLETESAALVRALTTVDDPPTIIVAMGAVSTELVLASGGNVLFTRSIATGGTNLTRAIISEFNLPAKQAEQYKQVYGILEDKLSGKVAAVLKPILDIIGAEILKALEFAHSHGRLSEVGRVVICGGGAYLPGLVQFLVERTSLEVSLGDAWTEFVKEGLITKLAGQGSVYAVATGLALRT